MHRLAQFADVHVVHVRERPGNRCSMVCLSLAVVMPYRIPHVESEYMFIAYYLLWQLHLHSAQCRRFVPQPSAWGVSAGESLHVLPSHSCVSSYPCIRCQCTQRGRGRQHCRESVSPRDAVILTFTLSQHSCTTARLQHDRRGRLCTLVSGVLATCAQKCT
jgi:hypothetical protein